MFNLCTQLSLHALLGMLDAAALLQLQHPANASVKAGAKLHYLLLFTHLYSYM